MWLSCGPANLPAGPRAAIPDVALSGLLHAPRMIPLPSGPPPEGLAGHCAQMHRPGVAMPL